MAYLLSLIFWFLGLFVTSFTVIPILIILVFGIPTTKKLDKYGLLKKDHKIIKNYFLSITILSSIQILGWVLVLTYIPQFSPGFIGGSIFSIIFGVTKIGKNKDNVSDYLTTNERHFNGTKEDILSILLVK